MRLLLLVIFLAISSFGKNLVKENIDIFIDKTKMGILYKGSEIVKNGENFIVSGWVMDGNEYILFLNNEDRIKLLKINDEYITKYKVLETKKDSYDVVWKRVSLEFQLQNSKTISESLSENIWINEEALYLRCGSCHKARTPEEYTVNQWPNVLKTMADRAGLSPEEILAVGSYLQYQALNHSKGEVK